MGDRDKLAGLLGFAAKAGRLVYGCELTLAGVRSGKSAPYLILIAADASENTKKRIRNCCIYYGRSYHVLPRRWDQAALSHATGREGLTACVGINDKGFADAIIKQTDLREEPAEIQQEDEGI